MTHYPSQLASCKNGWRSAPRAARRCLLRSWASQRKARALSTARFMSASVLSCRRYTAPSRTWSTAQWRARRLSCLSRRAGEQRRGPSLLELRFFPIARLAWNPLATRSVTHAANTSAMSRFLVRSRDECDGYARRFLSMAEWCGALLSSPLQQPFCLPCSSISTPWP